MASLSSRLNSGSLAVNAPFNVHVKSIIGSDDVITIECHSGMSVSLLIDELLKALPENKKGFFIGATLFLPFFKRNEPDYDELKPYELLGAKGIVNNTKLVAVYHDIYSKMSCIHPFPDGKTFSEHLHQWIEADEEAKRIDFEPPFQQEAVVRQLMEQAQADNAPPLLHPITPYTNGPYTSSRNTTLLLNHNNWVWDKETIFTLSNSQTLASIGIPNEQNFRSPINKMNSNVSYQPSDAFRKIQYITSEDGPEGMFEVPNYYSIRGILRGINITIRQEYLRPDYGREQSYERHFRITIFLSDPIYIHDKNGNRLSRITNTVTNTYIDISTILRCNIPYEMILMCGANGLLPNSMNELEAPNIGGRRRRTKKSKRTKNKRKTRSR